MASITKYEGEEMGDSIRYIKFSGDYDEFDKLKEKKKSIAIHRGILKYLIKEVYIPTEDGE